MHRGFVKLWRKTVDTKTATRGAKHLGVLAGLLIRTSHQVTYYNGDEIKPGQLATTVAEISAWAKETPKVIGGVLKAFTKDGVIKCENRANRYTLITICNWASYQVCESAEGKTEGKPRENQGKTFKELKNERIFQCAPAHAREREKLPPAFVDFVDHKTMGQFTPQLQQWRGVWGQLRQCNGDVVPILEWAKDGYTGGIGAPRFFVESTWPKIVAAYRNKDKSTDRRDENRLPDDKWQRIKKATKL